MTALAHEALVGNRGLLESGIGWGPVTRAAAIVLFQGLNDQIDAESERWFAADLALEELGMDVGVGQVEVQHVAPQDIHPGPRRSTIDAPPERFPNVAVMAYLSVPSAPQFQLDQVESSDITLFVESKAIAGPIAEGMEMKYEAIVHRRIERMTEAVHKTIAASGNLLGTINPIQRAPRGGIGNSTWLKTQGTSTGPRFLWQGSRLQYTLQRQSPA